MSLGKIMSDYKAPKLTCDLVMKGGITSGVVYPSAICELAKTYRFKNIGGTSVGAIAAATAAAAEYARQTGSQGFERFAELPGWLATDKNLKNLFQPSKATAPLYNIGFAFLGHYKWWWKPFRALWAAMKSYPLLTVLLIILDIILWYGVLHTGAGWVAWALITLCLLGIPLLSFAMAAWGTITGPMVENGFGLCSGMDRGVSPKDQPLTDWLSDEIDRIAGLPRHGDPLTYSEPLTFGDLWKPPAHGAVRTLPPKFKPVDFATLKNSADPDVLPSPDERAINLRMITTCLTFGHPYSLPFTTREFFIDPDDAAKLFPKRVCDWMLDNPAQPKTKAEAIFFELLKPLVPLPPADRLPLVVAARLSLIFPILLSAVRFYAVDMTKPKNDTASKQVNSIVRARGDDALAFVVGLSEEERLTQGIEFEPEPCWFSDGGISSNFPVQFFDAPLPRWPTFAIDLGGLPPDKLPDPIQANNVWMPRSNHGGGSDEWNRFGSDDGRKSMIGYLSTILDTSRNWVDSAQARTAGYRDRVVHVMLGQDEGGLNLEMSSTQVTNLSERGKAAGALLVAHYARPTPGVVTGWVNHRWVRYRSYVAMLENVIQAFGRGFDAPTAPGVPSYGEMIKRGRHTQPSSYRFKKISQRLWAEDLTQVVTDAANAAGTEANARNSLDGGAPHPMPELLVKPRT